MKKILLICFICFILASCSFSINTFAEDIIPKNPLGVENTNFLFQSNIQVVDPIEPDMTNLIVFDISKGQYTGMVADFITDLENLGYTVASIWIEDLSSIPDNVEKLVIMAASYLDFIDPYIPDEGAMMTNWVDNGGELLVLGENTDGADKIKEICIPYGVTPQNYLATDSDEYDGVTHWAIYSGGNLHPSHPIFTGVSEVEFLAGCYFNEYTGAIIITDNDGTADPYEAPIAYAKDYGDGRVAIFGDFNWAANYLSTDGYGTLDNAKMAINTILWLNGYFEIDVTKDFRYTSVNWDNIIYYEDFSTCDAGWIEDPCRTANWMCSDSNLAGGTPYEQIFSYSPTFGRLQIFFDDSLGAWPEECYFDIYDSEGNLIEGGYFPFYDGYTWEGEASCPDSCLCDWEICLYDDYGDGWNGNTIDIYVDNILIFDDLTLAAGSGPECYTFSVSDGFSWLQSPPINTVGRSWVEVSFKQYVDWYTSANDIFELGVETSIDGMTWTTAYSQLYSSDSGPETISFMLPNAFIDSPTTYIRFYFKGNSYDINNWYIDDVMINGDVILDKYLPFDGTFYLVDVVKHPKNNQIKSTNPGQLYGVITITGPVEELILWDVFDEEFDVHPGKIGGGVEVILVDPWGYATVLTDTSSIDFAWVKNKDNEVVLQVSLDNPLPPLYNLMIFIKYQTASKHVEWEGDIAYLEI